MGYKASEQDLMAYLYGELEGKEKEMVEQYLLENAAARLELEKLKQLRHALGHVKDKEVIAPPIFVGDSRPPFIWNAPYFKTIVSIAASLLIVMLVGKFSGMQIGYTDSELRISFGKPPTQKETVAVTPVESLSSGEVQQMINASLQQNNLAMQETWAETQRKLDVSIVRNLASNSEKIDNLVKESSAASQQQIRDFVATMQAENVQVVKSYFQLSSSEQKQYIESLLVDFAKYLQQQRNDDLQVVQTQLSSLQKNTDTFKQETEQILTSIISGVGSKNSFGTKY
jgi:hypothetical protein